MNGVNSERLEIANLLIDEGKWINTYPVCSYEIVRTLKSLEDYEKTVKDEFLKVTIFFIRKIMGDIWSSISSAASGEIEMETQLKLIKLFGDCWTKMGKNLSRLDKLGFFNSMIEFIIKYTSFVNKLRVSLKYPEETVLIERSEPTFFLSSGYRTFYFFNFDKITHNPEELDSLRETVLGEVKSLREKAHHEGKEITKIVVLEKAFGETASTVSLATWLAQETGLRIATLPSSPVYALKDRTKGMNILPEDVLLIVDGVITTGRGSSTVIKRIRKMMPQADVYGYVCRVHRELGKLPPELQVIETRIIDTKTEFIRRKLWKPEILKISFDSPFWVALDMECDYLREICIFTENEVKYESLRQKFIDLLSQNYEYMAQREELLRYLINVHILCWNSFYWDFTKTFKAHENMIPLFLEQVLEFEAWTNTTTAPCARIVHKEVETLKSEKRIDVNELHRILVKSREAILKEILEKPQIFKVKRAQLLIVSCGELLTDTEREELYEIERITEHRLETGKSYDSQLDERLLDIIDKVLTRYHIEDTKRKLERYVGPEKTKELERIKIPP